MSKKNQLDFAGIKFLDFEEILRKKMKDVVAWPLESGHDRH